MALTNAYLVTTKNLEGFLAAIQGAKAPERFSNKFLAQLDFTSTNDRLFVGLLKGLGFLDESGVPTRRYYAYLDQSESGRVLAEAIREAYEDLFAVNKNAQDLSEEEVKNKLKTLTQGQKSENVVRLMASTFKALCSQADWTAPPVASEQNVPPLGEPLRAEPRAEDLRTNRLQSDEAKMRLHYDIHIHLPESRDPAVFDSIFQALRKHLGT